MNRRLLPALLAMLALAIAACNGGGDDDEPTPAPSPTAVAATPAPDATPSDAIRDLDLNESRDVQDLAADTGGELVQDDVLYADLTEDGIEDAIVPITSGGTQGYIAFLVLTPAGDGTSVVLEEQPSGGGFQLSVEDDVLTMTEPVPGPDDPECCPSQLRRTTYGWDGSELTVDDVETVPNPDGGVKPPVVSP